MAKGLRALGSKEVADAKAKGKAAGEAEGAKSAHRMMTDSANKDDKKPQ